MLYLVISLSVLFFLAIPFGRTFFLLSALSLGGACVSALAQHQELALHEYVDFCATFLEFSVGFYAILSIIAFLKKRREKRRKEREEICRRAVYMLPDRENTFLRERLQTGLRVEEGEETERMNVAEEYKEIKLDYVQKMVARLKSTPLSASDRLETERLSRLVNLYSVSENLSVSDLRSLNDCMLKLLKLSAKYSVDCA